MTQPLFVLTLVYRGEDLPEGREAVRAFAHKPTDAELQSLRMTMQRYGYEAALSIAEVPLYDEPGALSRLVAAIDAELQAKIVGAVSDPTDARLNVMEREVRAQRRELAKMADALDRIATMLTSPSAAAPQVTRDRSGEQLTRVEQNLTPNQAEAARLGAPLVGTPSGFLGDLSQPVDGRASERNSGRRSMTAEMAVPMLAVAGRSATSTILSAGLDREGNPATLEAPAPKVGESLSSPTSNLAP